MASQIWREFPNPLRNANVQAPSVTLGNHTELGNQPYNDHGSQDSVGLSLDEVLIFEEGSLNTGSDRSQVRADTQR